MATGNLHLNVHLGHRWTAAAATIDGRRWPVAFDGQTRTPSGVWVDPQTGGIVTGAAGRDAGAARPDAYLPDPMAILRTATVDTDLGPGAAVSALLAHVANTASLQVGTAVTALTVTTPEPWGPKSRQRLTQAATAAGLPEPAIITAAAAAAAAAAAFDETPTGFVLVCTVDDDYPHLAVLDPADQYAQLAAAVVRDSDAAGITRAIAEAIRQRSGTGLPLELEWQAALEIDRARSALIGASRTPVLMPGQSTPVIVEEADLDKAARPHLDSLGAALTQALAEADIDQADIAATVVVAYDATASAIQITLVEAGLPHPVILSQPEQIATGAARLTGSTHPIQAATAATTRLPRTRLTIGSLTAVAVLATASVVLLLQTVRTADVSILSARIVGVRLPVAALALAAAIAATAATAAAQLAPTTWLSPQGVNDPVSTGYLLRRSYLAAAAAGLALGGLWGLGAGVGVSWTDPAYLRWALIAVTPVAACAVIIAAASPRIPANRLGDWIPRMRPPTWPIAVAVIGVCLVRAAYTLTFPTGLIGFPGLTAAIGAAALGAATAATVTRHLGIRLAVGVVLVPGYALVVTVSTIDYLTATYVAALAWWHLAATTDTIREAAPDNPLTRWLSRA